VEGSVLSTERRAEERGESVCYLLSSSSRKREEKVRKRKKGKKNSTQRESSSNFFLNIWGCLTRKEKKKKGRGRKEGGITVGFPITISPHLLFRRGKRCPT